MLWKIKFYESTPLMAHTASSAFDRFPHQKLGIAHVKTSLIDSTHTH